jgi:hypothetical protein
MTNRQPHRATASKRPATTRDRSQHTAAGISNRPPLEEEQRQEHLPPRGQAKRKTAGKKG